MRNSLRQKDADDGSSDIRAVDVARVAEISLGTWQASFETDSGASREFCLGRKWEVRPRAIQGTKRAGTLRHDS